MQNLLEVLISSGSAWILEHQATVAIEGLSSPGVRWNNSLSLAYIPKPKGSDGLQPDSDGLQPEQNSLQPKSNSLQLIQPNSDGLQMASTLIAMASNLIAMASNLLT